MSPLDTLEAKVTNLIHVREIVQHKSTLELGGKRPASEMEGAVASNEVVSVPEAVSTLVAGVQQVIKKNKTQ
jgi:hypothetical protein